MYSRAKAVCAANNAIEMFAAEWTANNRRLWVETILAILILIDQQPKLLAGKSDSKLHKARKSSGNRFYDFVSEKVIKSANRTITNKKSFTAADPIVDSLLKLRYHYSEKRLKEICKLHRQSMWAENIIGVLLEKYLHKKIRSLGWLWCPGNIIDKIDFIKVKRNGWSLLQVKNSSNTENSASKSPRKGTKIIMWYRRKATLADTQCWNQFPDKRARRRLSEKEFRKYTNEVLRTTISK